MFYSPIVDCLDELVINWSIGAILNAKMVNSMLDRATENLKEGEYKLIHADCEGNFWWSCWGILGC